jgi:superfamily II DNA/RNA helicase
MRLTCSGWLQEQVLARGCDVLVATPGRLQDFVGRGIVDLTQVQVPKLP